MKSGEPVKVRRHEEKENKMNSPRRLKPILLNEYDSNFYCNTKIKRI